MTHHEGLQVLLREFDRKIAAAREIIANPAFLNQEAPEFKKVKEEVNVSITAVFLYKNSCDDIAKLVEKESHPPGYEQHD